MSFEDRQAELANEFAELMETATMSPDARSVLQESFDSANAWLMECYDVDDDEGAENALDLMEDIICEAKDAQ